MIKSAKSINTFNYLMYLAMFLITFTVFPFRKYGLGSSKSLSIVPLIFYVIMNFLNGGLFVSKKYLKEIYLIVIILLISFLTGLFKYKNMAGFSYGFNMWMSYIIIMTAFATFFRNAGMDDIRKFLLSIFYSFKISLVFGILEIIYQFIAPINFIKYLVFSCVRDEAYFSRRVQFNFGEPSESVFIVIMLFPVIYLLAKLHYKFSLSDKIAVCMLVIIAFLFSQSVTFMLFLPSFCLLYFVSKLQNKKKYNFKLALILFLILMIAALVLIEKYAKGYAIRNNDRVLQLLTQPYDALETDLSTATRIAGLVVAFDMFLDSPFTGCGFGYFGSCLKDYIWSLDEVFQTPEMIGYLDLTQHQTYSIIFSSLGESGFCGALWLILLFSRLRINSQYSTIFVPLFLLYMPQSMFIYIPIMCLLYFLLTNHKVLEIANQDEYGRH